MKQYYKNVLPRIERGYFKQSFITEDLELSQLMVCRCVIIFPGRFATSMAFLLVLILFVIVFDVNGRVLFFTPCNTKKGTYIFNFYCFKFLLS